MLPEANFLSPWYQSPSSRAQNRGFCALLPFKTPIFGAFEHKIEFFVSERATFHRFCPLSSTKSAFLCAFALRDRHFRASRAQNRGIGVFVLGKSNRGEGVRRKGAVISETLTALNIQKKSFFCCLFRLFSNFASSFGSRQRD